MLGRIAVIAIIFWSMGSGAVMLPERVKKELGLVNHLQSKSLENHIRELMTDLAMFNLALPPGQGSIDPVMLGIEDQYGPDAWALNRLQSLFNASFARQSPEQILMKRNFFYGYDEQRVSWGVRQSVLATPQSSLYAVGIFGDSDFKIQLAPELKDRPAWRGIVSLAALLEADLRHQIARHYGGLEILRVHQPKLQVLSQVYTYAVLWELASQLPMEVLRKELESLPRLQPEAHRELLILLNLVEQRANALAWIDHAMEKLVIGEPEASSEIFALAAKVLVGHLKPVQRSWTLADFIELEEKMKPSLKRWWHQMDEGLRPRLLVQARARFDLLLSSTILAPEFCDLILKSK